MVAITGSAGKTTTKELVAVALAEEGTRVLKTHGNLNNLVGVPMMLFCLDEATDVAVIEIGTNAPGEIARLGAIGRPDVALITLVAAAHTEGLGTLADVAVEKASLVGALTSDGVAVLNADDAELAKAELGGRRAIRFGRSGSADVRITGATIDASLETHVTFEVRGAGEVERPSVAPRRGGGAERGRGACGGARSGRRRPRGGEAPRGGATHRGAPAVPWPAAPSGSSTTATTRTPARRTCPSTWPGPRQTPSAPAWSRCSAT